MTIRFRCNNYARYDEGAQRYVKCDQPLMAQPEQIGRRVRCPKCKQPVVVPAPDEMPLEAAPDAFAMTQPLAEMQMASFDRTVRCANCGTLLDEQKRCPECGHRERVISPDQQPIESIPVKTAGFQLWCQRRLSGGVSFKIVANSAHAMFAIFVALFALMAVLISGAGAILALLLLAVAVTAYVLLVLEARRLATGRVARPGLMLRPIWNLFLWLARRSSWKDFGIGNKAVVVQDYRGRHIGDREIADLENITSCNVLDLEGTSVTDQGLQYLRKLPNLRALVLRNTRVTEPSVFRVQQSNPPTWIWF